MRPRHHSPDPGMHFSSPVYSEDRQMRARSTAAASAGQWGPSDCREMTSLISELDCVFTRDHSINVSHRLCILFRYEMTEIRYPKARFLKARGNRTRAGSNTSKAFYSDWLFATTPSNFIMTVFSVRDHSRSGWVCVFWGLGSARWNSHVPLSRGMLQGLRCPCLLVRENAFSLFFPGGPTFLNTANGYSALAALRTGSGFRSGSHWSAS